MKCPACDNNLHEVSLEGIVLDVCNDGCGGIWFDRFELKKLDEPHEFTDDSLLDLVVDPKVQVDHSKKRNCPKCENIVMRRYFFSAEQEVEVDECPKCAGFWLDEGELFQIRKQYNSEEERKQAAKKHFGAMFEGQIENMKAESREKAEKARRISRMFRLITPSYYMSGLDD